MTSACTLTMVACVSRESDGRPRLDHLRPPGPSHILRSLDGTGSPSGFSSSRSSQSSPLFGGLCAAPRGRHSLGSSRLRSPNRPLRVADSSEPPRATGGPRPLLSSSRQAPQNPRNPGNPSSATYAWSWGHGMKTPPQPIRPGLAPKTLSSDHPVLVSTQPPTHAPPTPRAPAACDIDQLDP